MFQGRRDGGPRGSQTRWTRIKPRGNSCKGSITSCFAIDSASPVSGGLTASRRRLKSR